jgi:hypothetical protein
MFHFFKYFSQISQISCLDPNRAPSGCTQYFYDTTAAGTVSSFNFVNSQQLANQAQKICFRWNIKKIWIGCRFVLPLPLVLTIEEADHFGTETTDSIS